MKKIGKQVHLITTSPTNMRNGEGAFIKLKNGTIMYGYTEFFGNSREDEEHARICAIYSHDDGETWSEKRVIIPEPENALNIMSLSFLKMQNGDIGAFYIVKSTDGTDTIVLSRSEDDGISWSKPIDCLEDIVEKDYYVINNDRALRLKNGRILLPIARHTIHTEADIFMPGVLLFIYSDDDGKTWHKASQELTCPFPKDENGFQEPGIYELSDGRIWCYIRTGLGCQFQSFSEDNGETWSAPEPNLFFSSPCSPMSVKKLSDFSVAVFNPIPEHILRDDEKEFWGRTPYVLATSKDGQSFSQEYLYYLEDDPNNGYCYPAIYDGDDYFLVAYYHSNNSDCCLNCNKIIKIMYDEI